MLTAGQLGVLALSAVFLQDSGAELRAHYEEARAAQRTGDLVKAVEQYREVVRLAPGMAEAHLNLGLLCYALGALEQSTQELEKAEKIKPGLPGAHLYLVLNCIN